MSEIIVAIHDPINKELQGRGEMLELQFLNTRELISFEVGTAVNGGDSEEHARAVYRT